MEVVTLLMILIYNNDFIIDDMMNLSIEIFSSIYYILKSTRIDLVDYIIILKEI